jgi:hypothetical protein
MDSRRISCRSARCWVLVASSLLVPTLMNTGAEAQEPAASESVVVQEAAIDYYIQDRGLNRAEAIRRLEIQAAGVEALNEIRELLGWEWAESSYDDSDGYLVVNLTPAAEEAGLRRSVMAILTRHNLADVSRFRSVPYSARELDWAKDQIRTKLGSLADKGLAAASIDYATGEVDVRVASSLDEEQRKSVAAMRAGGVQVVLVDIGTTEIGDVPDACSFTEKIFCDNPLRGGVYVAPDVGGFCTAGFMATSRIDSKLYLMTAGHCLDNSSTWRTRNANKDLFSIGSRHNADYPGGDSGIISVSTSSHWWSSTGWGESWSHGRPRLRETRCTGLRRRHRLA